MLFDFLSGQGLVTHVLREIPFCRCCRYVGHTECDVHARRYLKLHLRIRREHGPAAEIQSQVLVSVPLSCPSLPLSLNALNNPRWSLCRTFVPALDPLDKALTVFKLPKSSTSAGPKRIHRRLDIVFAPWDAYWTAVVGWLVRIPICGLAQVLVKLRDTDGMHRTGSTQFERDLRIWSKEHWYEIYS